MRNKEGQKFVRSLSRNNQTTATKDYFDYTNIRRETEEKKPIKRGRMSHGNITIEQSGTEVSYMKKGKFVRGYMKSDFGRQKQGKTQEGINAIGGSTNPKYNREGRGTETSRVRVTIDKRKMNDLREKTTKPKSSIGKKIKGYLTRAAIVALIVLGGFGVKKAYDKFNDDSDKKQYNEEERNFLDGLENENISDEELADTIKKLKSYIEDDKLKNPLARYFNVSTSDIIINTDNPNEIIVIGGQKKNFNGEIQILEGEKVHKVDERLSHLISLLAQLDECSDSKSKEEVVKQCKGIIDELAKENCDNAILLTDKKDGTVYIARDIEDSYLAEKENIIKRQESKSERD